MASARGLVIREGLIFRNVRQIEYARIENIDTERGLLHRLLGCRRSSRADLHRRQTRSTHQRSRSRRRQDMREQIFADTQTNRGSRDGAHGTAAASPVHRELVRYGLIDNRGMILVAAGVGLLHEAGGFASQSRTGRTKCCSPLRLPGWRHSA